MGKLWLKIEGGRSRSRLCESGYRRTKSRWNDMMTATAMALPTTYPHGASSHAATA